MTISYGSVSRMVRMIHYRDTQRVGIFLCFGVRVLPTLRMAVVDSPEFIDMYGSDHHLLLGVYDKTITVAELNCDVHAGIKQGLPRRLGVRVA